MRVAIRVDASVQIGTGHLMRCLALADALLRSGAATRFITRHMSQYLQDMVTAEGHEIRLLDSPSDHMCESRPVPHAAWLGTSQHADAKDSVIALSDGAWDWLIVDHYALDVRWESQLRPSAKKILVIDDLADRFHDCDLLLDQNLYYDIDDRYRGKIPENCQLLLGPHFALLREEFARTRERSGPRIGNVRRLLIFFGGVDEANYTGRVIEALSQLSTDHIHVDVVIGVSHPCRKQIEAKSNECGFRCHVQTSRMAELMAGADLAIGAGGTALWERCCLGLPALVICAADNQRAQIEEAACRGLLYAPELGSEDGFASSIKCHISALLENNSLRRFISDNGMRAVDGRGVQRLVSKLRCHDIELRNATAEDERKLFEWRNHPSIRACSRNDKTISWESHQRWFASVLQDKHRLLLIGFRDDLPVGVVRFDVHEGMADISIYLVPESEQGGRGSALLWSAERWMAANRPDVNTIRACVLGQNERSTRLFLRAGYQIEYVYYSKELKK